MVAEVSPTGSARAAIASRAAVTEAREASARSSPACTAATSTGSAACTAAWDASSGRAEEETPSQTTATTMGPFGDCSAAMAIASSLR